MLELEGLGCVTERRPHESRLAGVLVGIRQLVSFLAVFKAVYGAAYSGSHK